MNRLGISFWISHWVGSFCYLFFFWFSRHGRYPLYTTSMGVFLLFGIFRIQIPSIGILPVAPHGLDQKSFTYHIVCPFFQALCVMSILMTGTLPETRRFFTYGLGRLNVLVNKAIVNVHDLFCCCFKRTVFTQDLSDSTCQCFPWIYYLPFYWLISLALRVWV